MATSKPDIMIILLSKLIEEGDSFYKVGQRLVVEVPAVMVQRYWKDPVTALLLCRQTEGEGEGGGAALSVRPQKVSTRRLQRGPQDVQGTQSIALPQPVPMSEENECKSARRPCVSRLALA